MAKMVCSATYGGKSSDGELIGDTTMHGALKMENGKPVGLLADGLIGLVNIRRALKLANMEKW